MKHVTRATVALMLVVAVGASRPAAAHAMLVRATPPVGATVTVAPAEVVITFDDALEAQFSSIAVQDAAGQHVDVGPAHPVAGDTHRLAVAIRRLVAGNYRVTWHATDIDTHKTQGSFSFTVAP